MNEWIEKLIEKLNYLTPSFIKRGEVLTGIYTAIANVLYTFYQQMQQIKDNNWTGKGLKMFANESHIFYHPEDKETTIQQNLQNRFTINQARGTVTGIGKDLTDLLLGEVELDLSYADKRGWVLGFTYPGIDYVFIDAPKLVIIEDDFVPDAGEIPDIIRLKPFIKREIIPIDTEIIRVQV